MAEIIAISLAKSLGLTLAVELPVGALLGYYRWKDLLLIFLVNVLTNPLLGLILDGIYLGLGILPGWQIMLPLEAAVVLTEGLLYRGRLSREGLHPLLFSLILNTLSYLGGMMI